MADSTQEIVRILVVLVVGGSESLLNAVRRGTRTLPGTEIITCGVREAPTRAAELRPFAMVMTEDVYAFDSVEFDALARDVRAQLITTSSDGRIGRSADALQKTIVAAAERRRGQR